MTLRIGLNRQNVPKINTVNSKRRQYDIIALVDGIIYNNSS